MKDANLDDLISESKIIVHSGRYAYLQAKETEIKNHFLVVKDEDETTVITEEKYFSETEHQNHVKWFKLFEIKLAAPFVGVGFIAKVTKTVAEKNLPVLVVSTYSKDYILLQEETHETAVAALQDVGFTVVKKS